MPKTLDKQAVLRLLADLDRRNPRWKLFGANDHDYKLPPPVPISVTGVFQKQRGVALPEDYRLFITEIGNGGLVPSTGSFRSANTIPTSISWIGKMGV